MADKKEGKKEDKKAPAPAPESIFSPEIKGLAYVIGAIIVLSLVLTNSNGRFFSLDPSPIEDSETGRVVGVDDGFKFPVGKLEIGDRIVLKNDTFVRSAPAQSLLGKQKKYETAQIQEGPLEAYNQNWWRLNFENAPDGWVPQYSMTEYVTTYKTLHFLPITWIFMKPILWVLIVVLLILFAAAKLRLKGLRAEAVDKLRSPSKIQERMPVIPSANHIVVGEEEEQILTAGDRRSNDRWMHIVQLLQSHNQNDWRQAIIEADIILEEMLEKMGYDGVTIGDKLKNVEPSDFRTINQAWEAHKIRNRIAHMGSEFQITHAEAEKVINMYQEVFDEFYFI